MEINTVQKFKVKDQQDLKTVAIWFHARGFLFGGNDRNLMAKGLPLTLNELEEKITYNQQRFAFEQLDSSKT